MSEVSEVHFDNGLLLPHNGDTISKAIRITIRKRIHTLVSAYIEEASERANERGAHVFKLTRETKTNRRDEKEEAEEKEKEKERVGDHTLLPTHVTCV